MGARAAQGMVEGSSAPVLLSALQGPGPAGPVGAALSLWLLAELLASAALAFGVSGAAAALTGDPAPRSWSRWALGLFFVGGAAMAGARLWSWTALGAGFGLYGRALLVGDGGLPAAAALSLALSLSLPLGLLATLWIRAGLAQAALSRVGYAAGLSVVIAPLRTRLAAGLMILLSTGLAGVVLAVTAGALLLPFSGGSFAAPGANELGWGVSVVGGALGGTGFALAQLWGLLALTALLAGEAGSLGPAFRPRPAVPIAQLVPSATWVGLDSGPVDSAPERS